MSKISILVLVLLMAFCLGQLIAQDYDDGYDKNIKEFEETSSSGSGARLPMIVIVIIIALIVGVLYHHILHKRFIEYLDQRMSPQSAAATCLLQWLAWVFGILLLFVGVDIVNMDFLHVAEHFKDAWVRIVVIVCLYVVLYLAISPYKKKQVN